MDTLYHRDLIKISSDMDELIQQYNLSYLVKLHKSIKAKIVLINEKINTKREVVKLHEYQRKIEEEQRQRQLLRQKQEQMRIDEEQQNNYTNLLKGNIISGCKCKYPCFIGVKYFCIMCYKHK